MTNKYRVRVIEQGLNENDGRRRDEEAKIDRVHFPNDTENSGKTPTS